MKAILLVNLGSPDSTEVKDVKKYLRQFLMDKYVLDINPVLRWLLLELIILPRRPKASAEAYQKIWTQQGSPLVVQSEQQQRLLQQRMNIPVELAMRYGSMSIARAMARLAEKGVDQVLVVPLYPQYAFSSYETVVQECKKQNRNRFQLSFQKAFFDHPAYLAALAGSIRKGLPSSYDFVLFSYHGIPERHITRLDSEDACLASNNCCDTPGNRLSFCYRAQSYLITSEMVKRLKLDLTKTGTAFQSRLGKTPWIKPYTDMVIEELARKHKHLVVVCPSFVADCLETLEEIGIRAREDFKKAGGETLTLVPCLNDHPGFIDALETMCKEQEFYN